MTAVAVYSEDSVLGRVEATCGSAAVLALCAAYGGRELYVPRPDAISEDHPLAVALGLACARRVAEELGHGRLVVPLGQVSTAARRRRAVQELKDQGKSDAFIAQALGVHVRTVERLKASLGLAAANDRQLPLF